MAQGLRPGSFGVGMLLTAGLWLACGHGRAQRPETDSSGTGLVVESRPQRPYIETRDGQQRVNFDLLIANHGQVGFTLVAIKLKLYDSAGKLEQERELNENGHPPAADLLGRRDVAPGEAIDIFQPFYTFDRDVDVARMRLDLFFMQAGHGAPPIPLTADRIVSLEVKPRAYQQASYCLPMRGLLLVHDGHDYDSHHRRYDLSARWKADAATAVAPNLYAYDLVVTNAEGALFRGDGRRKQDWLSYRAPLFAPADGVVVEAVSDVAENDYGADGTVVTLAAAEAADPLGMGNHVTLRHEDGRVSWMLHMQPGSVRVKVGARVKAGEMVGQAGFSGDALFPHLHYTVTKGAAYPSQGVPSYFRDFTRVLGGRRIKVTAGQVDTGDLIESESCK